MTGQQLKNSILQLAVQGKLVPQDPNDEPASVLLERIRAEKDALIKAGKIKKEKNPSVIFRGADNLPYEQIGKNEPVCIADEVPFELPDSWEWVRIINLGRNVNDAFADGPFGSNLKKEHYTNNKEVRLIQLSNIGENGWRNENTKYTTYKHAQTLSRSMVKAGSIVIAKMMPAGRAIIVPDIENDYILSSDAVKFIPHEELNIDYLYYAINSPAFRNQVVAEAHGVTRVRTSLGKLQTYFLPIPPLDEQRRIVDALNKIFPYVEQYETSEIKRKEFDIIFPDLLKKSILQEAVQGKLVPQDENDEPASVLLERIRAEKQALIKAGKIKKDKNESVIFRRDNSHYEKRGSEEVCIDDEIPFEIPESWEWVRFDSATIYTTDYVANGSFASLKENVKSYKTPNYAIMVKTQDFANNFTRDLTYTDESGFNFLRKSELYGGELMLSNIGASIGKAFIIPKLDKPMTLAPNSIVVKCIDNITTRYLQYLMLSFYGQEMLKGFTAGTAMPKFSKTQLRNALIPLPPHKLQERIVVKLDELFLKVDTL